SSGDILLHRIPTVQDWLALENRSRKPGNRRHSMLSISVIIFFSVVLFAYWFRYSCLLILQNRTSYNQEFALSSGLNFPVVQKRLKREGQNVDLLDQL